MSAMPRETTVKVRAEAMGLIETGWTQQAVANRFGVTTRAVRKWLTKRRSGEALANKPGHGRKPKLDRVSKIVIGKSLQKKGFSTWKLARKLTACGHPVSKSTMHKYLHNNIHAVPYKPLLQPCLTDQRKKIGSSFVRNGAIGPLMTGRRFSSQMSSPLNCSTLQTDKTTEYGPRIATTCQFMKPSNIQLKFKFGQ